MAMPSSPSRTGRWPTSGWDTRASSASGPDDAPGDRSPRRRLPPRASGGDDPRHRRAGRVPVPLRLPARRLRHLQGAAGRRAGGLPPAGRRHGALRRGAGRRGVSHLPGGPRRRRRDPPPGRRSPPFRVADSFRTTRSEDMGVMRLGYMHVRVTDLEEAKQHYSNTLGMNVVAEDGATAHLKCWDEWDHHSLVLETGGVGLVKAGYKCATAEDLDIFEHRAAAFGATVSRMSKGDNLAVGDGIRVVLPSDHVIELYHDIDYGGTETGTLNPDPWPRDRRGVGVPWIDHFLVTAEDPATTERFMTDVLDFRASERAITDPA